MAKPKNADPNARTVAENRKARFNYEILDTLEAGIQLKGTEVKSLREGRTNIADSYAGETKGELWLYNAYIPEYQQAGQFNHETRRPRSSSSTSARWESSIGSVQQEGMTLGAAQDVLQRARGSQRCSSVSARGKKTHDKRETEKKRDWERGTRPASCASAG